MSLGTVLFVAPINILGAICSFLLPDNQDLYLNNVVVAKKVSGARA
jgi:hypothetical protein